MNSIPVKLCCHGFKDQVKYSASIGDSVLIRTKEGLLQELLIEGITTQLLNCRDLNNERVDIAHDQVVALYIP